jgi:hypothetical protein
MKRLQTTQTGLYSKTTKENSVSPPKHETNEKTMSEDITASNLYSEHVIYQKDPNGFAPSPNKFVENCVHINRNIENLDLFKSLITSSSGAGIIYSDSNIKVDLKLKIIEKNCLGLIFSFISNSGERIDDIEMNTQNDKGGITFNMSKVKYSNDNTPPQIFLKVILNESFNTPPLASLTGHIGMTNISSQFTLPVLITKYLTPNKMPIENYSMLWYSLSNESNSEYHKLDCLLNNPSNGKLGVMDFLKKLGTLLISLNFHIFPPNDLNQFHEIEAASMLEYQEGTDPITILVQASFIPSHTAEFRLSVRAKVPKDIRGFENITLDVLSVIKFYVNP